MLRYVSMCHWYAPICLDVSWPACLKANGRTCLRMTRSFHPAGIHTRTSTRMSCHCTRTGIPNTGESLWYVTHHFDKKNKLLLTALNYYLIFVLKHFAVEQGQYLRQSTLNQWNYSYKSLSITQETFSVVFSPPFQQSFVLPPTCHLRGKQHRRKLRIFSLLNKHTEDISKLSYSRVDQFPPTNNIRSSVLLAISCSTVDSGAFSQLAQVNSIRLHELMMLSEEYQDLCKLHLHDLPYYGRDKELEILQVSTCADAYICRFCLLIGCYTLYLMVWCLLVVVTGCFLFGSVIIIIPNPVFAFWFMPYRPYY